MPNASRATQSAVEWFFQSGSSEANFPADGITYELSKVRDDCLRLAGANIFTRVESGVVADDPLSSAAKDLYEAAISLSNNRASKEQLISSVDTYVRSLSQSEGKSQLLPVVKPLLSSLIVNLVMLAKSSRDLGIRQQIIELAEHGADLESHASQGFATS